MCVMEKGAGNNKRRGFSLEIDEVCYGIVRLLAILNTKLLRNNTLLQQLQVFSDSNKRWGRTSFVQRH